MTTKLITLVSMIMISMIYSSYSQEIPNTNYPKKEEEVTHLEFYFHDTISGQNPSAVRVAQAKDTVKSLTIFGAVVMADDPLTETPEPDSKLVGRAQGLYGSAGQHEIALIMALSFVFTEGKYNGSSVSILGRNPILSHTREMPIVGGTGMFRMARGYAIAQTHWFNLLGDAIVGYNLTIVH